MWPALSRRWRDVLYAGALVAFAIAFLVTEHVHDLTFPIPWPDEGSFLWPALAFRDHFSLYAPEVNPEREIFWMPPGFMVMEGIIFKVWDFSLIRARLLSALFLVAAMACLAVQIRPSRARLGGALLIIVAMLSPIFQLVGNTARMESLVLLFATSGFLLLDRGKSAGLGVLAVAPLFHPNGVFACVGGLAYWLVAFRGRRRLSRADVATFAVVLLLWLLYALHLQRHWPAFVEDMRTQMQWKQAEAALNGTAWSRLAHPFRIAAFVSWLATLVAALWLRVRVGALLSLALPLFVGSGIAVGWLYEVYAGLGVLLMGIAAHEITAVLCLRLRPRAAYAAWATSSLLFAGFAQWAMQQPFLTASVQRATMGSGNGVLYCTRAEHDLVETFIRGAVRKDRPIVVQFLPDADSLLFNEMRSPSVHFLQQTYFSTRPDVYILHDTPWFPQFLRDIELADFAIRNRVDLKLPEWPVIAKTTRGTQWVAVQHEGPGRPWY